jgi:pyrrolidone-carboxylate peptidase
MRQRAEREQGLATQLGIAAGAFVCAVSFSLFIHSISQLSSPIVSALFIAGGIVLRQRATTPTAHAIAIGMLIGGIVAAIASLVLAATDT